MSHNVKFSFLSYMICNSETRALIRVIDSLMRRGDQVALLLLLLIRHAEDDSGSGSRFVSNFPLLIT